MNRELLKKLGGWFLIGVAGLSAIADAVSKQEQEKQFKNALKDIEILKAKVKDS